MTVLRSIVNGALSDASDVNQYKALVQGGQVFDVKNGYAATGNGSTDDTAAIQAALDAAHTAGGGTVLIPDGTYMILATNTSGDQDYQNGGVRVYSNTRVTLSANAILKAITNASQSYAVVRVQDASNVLIEGGQVQGERSTHTGGGGEWGYGIAIYGGDNITIRNLKASNCWGDGLVTYPSWASHSTVGTNVHVRDCTFDNNRRQGISAVGTNGLVVSGCTLSNSNGTAPQAGIDVEPVIAGGGQNVRIEGCYVFGCVGNGITVDTATTGPVAIVGNTVVATSTAQAGIQVYNTTGSLVAGNTVIGATGSGSAGIRVDTAPSTSVTGNAIRNCWHGIMVAGGVTDSSVTGNVVRSTTSGVGILSSSASLCSISANTIRSTGDIGLSLYASTNVQVTGNLVIASGTDGISAASTSDNCQIDANHVVNAGGHGIVLGAGEAYRCNGNYVIASSQLSNGGYDNIIVNCANASLSDNTVRQGALANKPGNGIDVLVGASNAVLDGNDVRTGGTANLLNSSTTSTIRNNPGFNPQGVAAITVTASPFIYTAGATPEAVYISGGTVSLVVKNSITLFTATGCTVWLEPAEAVTVTYSVLPTMNKDRK